MVFYRLKTNVRIEAEDGGFTTYFGHGLVPQFNDSRTEANATNAQQSNFFSIS